MLAYGCAPWKNTMKNTNNKMGGWKFCVLGRVSIHLCLRVVLLSVCNLFSFLEPKCFKLWNLKLIEASTISHHSVSPLAALFLLYCLIYVSERNAKDHRHPWADAKCSFQFLPFALLWLKQSFFYTGKPIVESLHMSTMTSRRSCHHNIAKSTIQL